jgi:TonB dependent receptor/TonB-dependent Receptor Plug Domain
MTKSWKTGFVLLAALAFASRSMAANHDRSLISALEELRAEGLNIVYSSALISPDLRAPLDPDPTRNSSTPVERARRLLAPHGLDLKEVRAGDFVVVRATKRQASATTGTAPAQDAASSERARPELPAFTVYASRYEIDQQPTLSSSQLTRESLNALPGLNQDVQRAVQHLPGTGSSTLSARTHVRGGREDELAVYFDGVVLDDPFHFKDFPGPKGLLDPGAVSSLELFSGVLPVRYGNALSGVIDLKPRRWDGENHHEIGASLLYGHALSQGRLEDEPLEWLAVVRHSSYKGAVDDIADPGLGNPDLRDVMGRLQWDAGEHTRFTLGWLALDDQLASGLSNEQGTAFASYKDHTAWIAWRQTWTSGMVLNTLVSTKHSRSHRDGIVNSNGFGGLNEERAVESITTRSELSLPLTEAVHAAFGTEWSRDSAQYDENYSTFYNPAWPPAAAFADLLGREYDLQRHVAFKRSSTSLAAYASTHWQLSERLAADIGTRVDEQEFTPRAFAEYRLSERTTLRAALGVQSQAQRASDLHAADGETEIQGVERAQQAVLGLEQRLSDTVDIRVEGYTKRVISPASYYENLFDPVSVVPEIEVDRVRVEPDRSHLHGAELSLNLTLPHQYWAWFQYTWSDAQDEIDGRKVPRAWNARHAVKAGVSWRRASWQLTASSNWHTGWRTTALTKSVEQPGALELGPRNGEQWPSWFSLDFRASWTHPMPYGALRVVAELSNATGSATLCCSAYGLIGQSGEVERPRLFHLPRKPFVGVTWEIQ